MTAPTEWVCWTLYREDLEYVACKRNLDLSRFDEGEFDLAARRFRKGVERALKDWEYMLAEAIELVLRGKKPPTATA